MCDLEARVKTLENQLETTRQQLFDLSNVVKALNEEIIAKLNLNTELLKRYMGEGVSED